MRVCAAQPGQQFSRAVIALEEACMPLDSRPFAPLILVLSLVLTTHLAAGDQPLDTKGLAPPERFSAEQRGHWAYQPVKRRAKAGQGLRLGA